MFITSSKGLTIENNVQFAPSDGYQGIEMRKTNNSVLNDNTFCYNYYEDIDNTTIKARRLMASNKTSMRIVEKT